MKHTIIYLAAGLLSAAAMLTSCDYRLDDDNSGSIRFTAEAVSFAQPGVRTKATPVNTVSAFTDTYTSFKVNAYKGTTAKFTGGTSTYSNGEWNLTATDVKWWPDETLDFYALAFPETTPPMITLVDEMVVNPSTKTAIFDYTFSMGLDPATGEDTPDIMFGYYSGTGTASGGKRIAPLTFYHPFAAVKFKAGADLVGATVNSITIRKVANGGTCTIAASNLETAGNSAISWTHDSGHRDYSNSYTAAAITAADQQIGTDDQTFILIPQTLGATAKLEVSLTITDEGVSTDVTLEASLENVVLEAGKILTFTINYADISISVIEPEGMIIPWETIASVHIKDPQLVPKYAYLPTGALFNDYLLNELVGTRPLTKIVFNRFGTVDETTPDTIQIQEAGHDDGEIIYAHYSDGVVTITTHANTIFLNADCSGMFKNMTGLTEITWGNFFDSSLLANTSEMFMGCTALTVMDVSGVLVTTNVTNMSHMFDGCTGLVRLNLSFSTANALDLSFMFHDCSSLTVPPITVNAPNATTFESMYENCTGFDSMQVSNIISATNLKNLFKNCRTRKIEFVGSPFTWPTLDDNLHAEGMFLNAFREGGFINGMLEEPHAWLVEHADLDPAIIYHQ